ncbi:MAG: AMP-binding protein, partial [Ilumatobacteraceae bacterium]
MSADSYTAGATDAPLIEDTIDANFRATVSAHGDREALVVRHQGIRWSYNELDAHIDHLARALFASGLNVGDRVALWSPNRYEWVLAQYATARIGAIMVCINPAYRTHELEFALNQSGSVMLLAAPDFKTSNYKQMWADVAEQCPGVREAVFFDDPTWETLLERAEHVSSEQVAERSAGLANTDPINIQYTSGTTGLPKGATLTHRNILNNGYFVGEACGYTEHDRVCIPVPFYHCFGMVMGNLGCTSHGSTMVIPNDAFEPVSVLSAVQEEKCTSLYGVPTMFIAELGVPEFESYDLSSLRTGIMAGSPCPVEVMKQVIERMNMDDVTIAYGMTETSPVSTQTGADDSIDKRVGSVGR